MKKLLLLLMISAPLFSMAQAKPKAEAKQPPIQLQPQQPKEYTFKLEATESEWSQIYFVIKNSCLTYKDADPVISMFFNKLIAARDSVKSELTKASQAVKP